MNKSYPRTWPYFSAIFMANERKYAPNERTADLSQIQIYANRSLSRVFCVYLCFFFGVCLVGLCIANHFSCALLVIVGRGGAHALVLCIDFIGKSCHSFVGCIWIAIVTEIFIVIAEMGQPIPGVVEMHNWIGAFRQMTERMCACVV